MINASLLENKNWYSVLLSVDLCQGEFLLVEFNYSNCSTTADVIINT